MWMNVDPKSDTPVSTQIERTLIAAIAEGRLEDGAKLPSVRAAAELWRVNPNTVAKVYQELERLGFAEAKNGSGVWIVAGAYGRAREKVIEQAFLDLEKWAEGVRRLGLSDDEMQAMVERALHAGVHGGKA